MTDELHESSSEHAPPIDPLDFELEPELPGWTKPVGIISIVLSAIGLTCAGCGAAGMFLMPRLLQAGGEDTGPLPPTMQFGMQQYIQMGVGLVLTVILLVAGIMCVSRNYSSRLLHIIYGIGAIPHVVWSIMLQLDVAAKMNQFAIDNPDSPFSQSHSPMGVWIGIGFTVLLALPWPLFCLAWFGFVKRKPDDFTGGRLLT